MPNDALELVGKPLEEVGAGFRAYFADIMDDWCGTPTGHHPPFPPKRDVFVAIAIHEMAQQLSSVETSKTIRQLALETAIRGLESLAKTER
jgi:hypothetical protein